MWLSVEGPWSSEVDAMFAVRDAKWFRKESEHCLAQADETICLSSRAQWLLFAD
jgi:hypothetical protein